MKLPDWFIGRWAVTVRHFGFPPEPISRHWTESRAKARRQALVGRTRTDGKHVRGLTSLELALVEVEHIAPLPTPRRPHVAAAGPVTHRAPRWL